MYLRAQNIIEWLLAFNFIFLTGHHVTARADQFHTERDSLYQLLEISPDELKSRIFLQLSMLSLNTDTLLAETYAQKSLQSAQANENDLDQIRALCQLAMISLSGDSGEDALTHVYSALEIIESARNKSYSKNQLDLLEGKCLYYKAGCYDKAYTDSTEIQISDLIQAIDLIKTSDDYHLIADAYLMLGQKYADVGIFDQSLENLEMAIPYYQSLGAKKKLADAYKLASNFVERTKKIEYKQKAIDVYSEMGDSLNLAHTYLSLSYVTKNFLERETSLEYFRRALEIYKKLENYSWMAFTYFRIGTYYLNEFHDTLTGMNYYFKGIDLIRKHNVLRKAGHLYVAVATVYTTTNKLDSAGYWFRLADSVTLLMPKSPERTRYLYQVGQYYRYLKQYDLAEQKMLEALKLTKTEKDPTLKQNIYRFLYFLYRDMGDYKRALEIYKKRNQTADSLFKKETERDVVEMQIRYETREKEHELAIMKKNEQLKDEEIRKNKIYIFAFSSGFMIILLFSIILTRQYLVKRKAFDKLVEKNMALLKCNNKPVKPQKDENGALDPELREQILKKLNYQVRQKKCFLKSNLTLNMLSKKCSTNSSYLSRLINLEYHTNFNNFINELRIREAQKMMTDEKYQAYSIEGLSSVVGFKSKSVFNTAFKKYTGVTPSYYLEYLKKESQTFSTQSVD